MPLSTGDDDPPGTEDLATHRLPLAEAAHGHAIFQQHLDGAVEVLLKPRADASVRTPKQAPVMCTTPRNG
jgi:hypothetical protein